MNHHVPLTSLQPRYVEFTDTKGVLRCLASKDSLTRARGLIFLCPECKKDKHKAHNHIFLFDMPGVPDEARPHGRFLPTYEQTNEGAVPEHFQILTLRASDGMRGSFVLKPQDTCGLKFIVTNGTVSW